MTKEEAITILKDISWQMGSVKRWENIEAIDMAIEALTEPINCVKCKHYYETEDDTDVHGHCRMDTAHTNLISRADALRELNGACSNWKDDCKVAEIINALPSADAVEVVRCRNCYYAEDDITHMFCVYFGHKVYGDDYCSNAVERREDGGE